MGKPLRLLVIEDSEDDTQLLMRELRLAGYEVEFIRVETAEALQLALTEKPWDLVLSDYHMPQFDALHALKILQALEIDLPFIIISGTIGEETAVAALKAGANNFLIKGNWIKLAPVIEQELNEAKIRRERRQVSQPAEELFGNAFRLSPVGICITTVDGRLLKISQSMLDMLGYPLEELEGKHFNEITHPDDLGVGSEAVTHMMSGLVPSVSFEKRYLRKDGGTFWALVSSSLLRDSAGQPVHFITHILDMTERRRHEEALRRSEENFSKAFRSSPVALMITRLADGKFLELNEAYCKIVGYDRTELLGRRTTEFNIYVYPEQRQEILKRLFENGQLYNYEAVIQDQSGARRTVLASLEQIQFSGENCLLTTMLDITERKQAEDYIRYQSNLLQNISDAVISSDLDFRITTWNPAAEKIYGWDANEVMGKPVDDFLQTTYERTTMEQVLQEFQEQGIWKGEAIQCRKDGSQITVLSSVSQVKDGNGNPIGVIAINRDITDRKQSEDRIRRQLQRLSGLRAIDMAISSTFDMNVSLTVLLHEVVTELEIDAAAVLLLDPSNLTLEYAAGTGFTSPLVQQTRLRLGEGAAGRAALDRKNIHLNDFDAFQRGFVRKDMLKLEQFCAYFATPLVTKGDVKGVLEIFHRAPLHVDPEWLESLEMLAGQAAIAIENAQLFENLHRSNTDLERRVEERTSELNHTNAELERANRTKDEFLANMSHELRTPLTSILGLSESLLEQRLDTLSERQTKSLQIIESSGRHLLELINDILDLSKIEAGKFDFYPQPVVIDEFCRSCLTFVRAQALKKSITVNYTNEASISKILADPRRLKQILINLLINAVKFTAEQGNVSLFVRSDVAEDIIQFSVIDTGIGISPENMQRLFRPFMQVESSLNRQYEGTGLGLALVQRLTDLHGGSVTVESEVGQGSRFTVSLACKTDELARLEASSSHAPPLAPKPGSPKDAQDTGSPHKILLAEDNPANILMIEEYLKNYGYEVVIAQDGLEAIQKAEEQTPDLILMDIQMPVVDGLEAMTRLRKFSRFTNTPIIALTALAMPGDRERCLAAGATEYMSKPVSLKKLRDEIVSLLRS